MTLLLLLVSVLAVFEFRVNVLLVLYMAVVQCRLVPAQSFVPLLDSYLDLEKWWSPQNFEGYQVPEIEAKDWSWDAYLKASKGRRLVTVVRGLMSNTSAYKEFCSSDWIQEHGDFQLTEAIARDTYRFAYDYQTVNFSSYIRDIQHGRHRYSNGLDEMLVRYPDIVEAMSLNRLQSPHGCRALAIFINGNGTGFQWHNANHFNMVMQYHGVKTWQLLDPKYSLFAAPVLSKDPYGTGFFAESPKTTFDKLPTFEVRLSPGDVLLNPVWSWHRVRNEADPDTNLVAMASCRFSESYKALTAPALEFARSFKNPLWVSTKVPLFVRFIPFFRILQDGVGMAFDLFPTWGKPGYEIDCFSSKKQACDDQIELRGLNWVKSNSSDKA